MEQSNLLNTRRINTIPFKWFLGLEGLLCGGFVVLNILGMEKLAIVLVLAPLQLFIWALIVGNGLGVLCYFAALVPIGGAAFLHPSYQQFAFYPVVLLLLGLCYVAPWARCRVNFRTLSRIEKIPIVTLGIVIILSFINAYNKGWRGPTLLPTTVLMFELLLIGYLCAKMELAEREITKVLRIIIFSTVICTLGVFALAWSRGVGSDFGSKSVLTPFGWLNLNAWGCIAAVGGIMALVFVLQGKSFLDRVTLGGVIFILLAMLVLTKSRGAWLGFILGVPYYFPTFENIPPEIKFARIYRFGIPLSPLLIPLVKSVARIYAHRATLIFAVNEGARKNMTALNCPEAKISKLLYATWGVDTELFTPRTNGNEPDMGANAVLFVGRLVEQKGIIVLLEAFVKVKAQIPDAQLFIIGAGPLKEKITQIANAKKLTDSIHLLGMILNQHLPPYFRAARVTVTPSITTQRWAEQVGMVNIQSIACGTPVISTQSGSIPEFVTDGLTAILVPERNPEALANAIIRVLSDEKLRTYLSQNCRSIAEEHYDARKNIIRVENVLWNCLFGEKTPDEATVQRRF